MTTRISLITAWLLAMMQPAPGQGQPQGGPLSAWRIEIGQPVEHFVLCDVDGDGLNDALFVTGTRPPLCVVARRLPGREGFGPAAAFALPGGCDGVMLQQAADGAFVLELADGVATARGPRDFGAPPKERLPSAPAPPFLGYAQDLDGDRIGDPLIPVGDGYHLVFSKDGRKLRLSPPVVREREAGVRGLVSERARFPMVSFETLAPGTPPRPCFFANDTLTALRGSLESGFGPEVDALLRVPSASQAASLERTEARLVDLEGDGTRELLVVRTRTEGSALAQVRTELIFHRIGGDDAGRPAQAILLPGILSSGPDLKDVDGDGRLDLFLSVFGGNLTQHLARRITGRVRLEYLLYRGAVSGPPFERSPDFSDTDPVPEEQFTDFALRNRWVLDDDWSGDGRPDLVRMTVGDATTRIEILPGVTLKGKAGFATSPSSSLDVPVAVKDHRPWRLGPAEPAIICRTETGALVLSVSR